MTHSCLIKSGGVFLSILPDHHHLSQYLSTKCVQDPDEVGLRNKIPCLGDSHYLQHIPSSCLRTVSPSWPWSTIPRREPDHGHLVLENVIHLWAARILRSFWGRGCPPVCWHVCMARAAVGLESVSASNLKPAYFSKKYFGFIWDKIRGTSSSSGWVPGFGVLRSRIWLGYVSYQGRDPLKKSVRQERMLRKRVEAAEGMISARYALTWSRVHMESYTTEPFHHRGCIS